MFTRPGPRPAIGRTISAVIMILLAGWGTPAQAQPEQGERRLAAARERVHVMLREAEELQARGRHEAAAELRREAEQLAERVELRASALRREHESEHAHLRSLIERLELGTSALEELGRRELAMELQRVLGELHGELEGAMGGQPSRELEIAERQLEVLRLAFHAMREAERGDAAEAIGRAIRAREVALMGRCDDEARKIRERGPGREELRELVRAAAELWAEFGWERRAERLARAVDELWPARRPRERDRPREEDGRDLEIMELARDALREAGREDSAELMQQAIQAAVVRRRGLRGEEARIVLERAPDLAVQVELLRFASDLWRRFGDAERAEMTAALADRLWSSRDRPRRERAEAGDRERRMDQLQRRLRELGRAVEEIQAELDRLRRDG